ncbi:DUF342 domain-containing protein [Niallia taxi]|uniref:DUF342 domain-containing protein n=1 Tax=Niallia taxi TaxID=2499688 RepID=UPI0015F748F8|nr:FapA family protein [Niallia taxi]
MQERYQGLENCINIRVSADHMTAFMFFDAERVEESFAVTVKELHEYIEKQGILFGIDMLSLNSFVDNPYQFNHKEIVIAKGKKPINGLDSYVELVIKKEDGVHPKQKDKERVDYRSITEIMNVVTGQIIAAKTSGTKGEDGKTVFNELVKAKPGRDTVVKVGQNVIFNPENDTVIAKISGQVSVTANGAINVLPVYEIKGDLDMSVGNIDFVGNVIIHGDVRSGYSVKAEGDIIVYGGVGGSHLRAGGSIYVKKGINGHDVGIIRAGNEVKALFITNANVKAGRSVAVEQSVMHSEIGAGEVLECHAGKGFIVGGTIRVGRKLICNILGNNSYTVTHIVVDTEEVFKKKLNNVVFDLKEQMENLKKLKEAVAKLKGLEQATGKLTGEQHNNLFKLSRVKSQVEKTIKELRVDYTYYENELTKVGASVVIAKDIVYANTKITFGNTTKIVNNDKRCMKYCLINGDLKAETYIS